jgi:hypothetical protein
LTEPLRLAQHHDEQIVSRATKPLGAMDGLYLWRPPSIFALAAA